MSEEMELMIAEWRDHDVTQMREKELETQAGRYKAMLDEACSVTSDPTVAACFARYKNCCDVLAMFKRRDK